LLISSDLLTIQVWDQQAGGLLYIFSIIDQQKAKEKNTPTDQKESPEKNTPTDQKEPDVINKSTEQQEKTTVPNDLLALIKPIHFVSESSGRVAAVSNSDVFVWSATTGDLASTFSLCIFIYYLFLNFIISFVLY
jgi:hypothetical protein